MTALRTGDWMQTFTGRAFYPLDPRPEDIDERDIAHALSLICRYGGHVKRFYSVAEHCVLLSRYVAPEHALWALLHDATEAYVGDMIRPLKRSLPTYKAIEDHLMGVIAEKFGLAGDKPPYEVKDADNRILLDERRELMELPAHAWGSPIDDLEPLWVTPVGWAPDVAEDSYLHELHYLTNRVRP